jgi:hypothetical protein
MSHTYLSGHGPQTIAQTQADRKKEVQLARHLCNSAAFGSTVESGD